MLIRFWMSFEFTNDNALYSQLRPQKTTKSKSAQKCDIFPSFRFRLANRHGMAGIVPELTHGVPCPGEAHFVNWNVKIDHRAWIYGCLLMSVLYFVLCLSVTHHDLTFLWLDLSVMSLTNEIVIIRLAANTINNDECSRHNSLLTYSYLLVL